MDAAEEEGVVCDLQFLGELTVEVSERAGDDRARASRVVRAGELLEELGRARRRAMAGSVELALVEDADAEPSRGCDRARADRVGA